MNVYRTLAEAKKGVLLYRTVKASLVERNSDQAKAWLMADAERSRSEARAHRERARDAADQVDMFTGKRAGPHCPEAMKCAKLARDADRDATAVEEAAGFTHMSALHLDAALDHALGECGRLKDEADERSRKNREEQARARRLAA